MSLGTCNLLVYLWSVYYGHEAWPGLLFNKRVLQNHLCMLYFSPMPVIDMFHRVVALAVHCCSGHHQCFLLYSLSSIVRHIILTFVCVLFYLSVCPIYLVDFHKFLIVSICKHGLLKS